MVIKAGETAHNTRTVHPRAFRAASSPLPCRTFESGPQVSRSARSRKALARADSADPAQIYETDEWLVRTT
jgi:hypothetical protein